MKNKEKIKFNKKEYMKKYLKEYRKRDYVKEKQKAYDKKRYSSIEYKNYREEYNEKNKKSIIVKQKVYNKTPKSKLRQKKYREKNPEKIKARSMANKHLKHLRGPGEEFHHLNYARSFDHLAVVVMPMKEHRALHAQLNSNKY